MADIAIQPVDYSGLASAVPNPLAGEAALTQIGNARLQGEAIRQQMALRTIALQRQLAFGHDLGAFVKNPTAQGLAALYGKYPEFEQQAAAARSALDRGDITELGSAAALAAKGDYAGAANIIQQRIDAEKANGADTLQAEEVLGLLQSGDPQKQKAALGMLSLGVGVAVGPEKAAEFLKANGLSSEPVAVGMDQRLVNPMTGEQTVGAQPKLENVTNPITGESTGFNPYTGTYGAAAAGGSGAAAPASEGGGQASGGATGLQGAVATVLKNEGGYTPADMNGSPTNFGINFKANKAELAKMGITAANFKNMTQAQAAQIYASKYWPQSGAEKLAPSLQTPYFDVYVRNPALAKKALAQSGGDPAKFVQLTSAAFQGMAKRNPKAAKYAQAWANRDANNLAIATGGAAAAPAAATQASDPYHFGGTGLNTKEAETGFAWNANHTAEIPIPGGTEDPGSYNPQEVDDLARNWIVTGSWGSGGGMGGGNIPNGLKKAAMSRASSIMQSIGISSDQLPQLRSQYAADKSSLNNINGTLSGLQASERALHLNARQVLNTQQQLVKDGILDNGSPILNDLRLGTYKHVGSAKTKAHIKAYEDSMNAYAVEYAKFMSSANGIGGSAAPSDSSQERAADLNDTAMGPSALRAHINQTLIEAENRRKGIEAQAATLNNRLSSYLQPHKQAAPAGVTQIHTVQQYKGLPHGAHYIDPNGVYRIKP